MGCFCKIAAGIAKILLFVSNVLFLLSGITIIVLGSLMLQDLNEYAELFNGVFYATPIIVICIGSVICLIGFCGCFGALIESRIVLIIYAVLLVVVFFAKVAIGIVALCKYSDINEEVPKLMQTFFEEEYWNDTSSESFDKMHQSFHCCGVNGPADFAPIFSSNEVPASCCSTSPVPATCTVTSQYLYDDGCTDDVIEFVTNSFEVIGIVCLTLACLEMIALLFALCLAGRYGNNTHDMK